VSRLETSAAQKIAAIIGRTRWLVDMEIPF